VASNADSVSLDRAWALRAVLVLQAPRAVFAALRDDSDEAAQARQEPVLALAWLAGMAGVLASPVARTLLDDPARDGLVVGIWAFIGGGIYAAFVLWLGGALLHGAMRALGGQDSYRRARHLLAYASAPVALSLFIVWPIGIAAFGGDLFRSGGSDAGTGGALVTWAAIAFAVWSLALVGLGVCTLQGWTWARSIAALLAAALPIAALAALQAL